jgi:hypothetical protein
MESTGSVHASGSDELAHLEKWRKPQRISLHTQMIQSLPDEFALDYFTSKFTSQYDFSMSQAHMALK